VPIFKTLLDADGPDFNGERIKTVLNEAYSNANGGIVGVGHQYSMAFSHSNVTAYGSLNETLSGLTAIKTMKTAVETNDFDSLSNEIKQLHAKISSMYLKTLVHSDCDKSPKVASFFNSTRSGKVDAAPHDISFDSLSKSTWNLGFPINFVSRAVSTVHDAHEDVAPLRILSAMMGSKFLLREIREFGGAYGAGASHVGGAFRLFSYRDPSGLSTLAKYSKAVEWVQKQDWTERDVNEAILKVFQGVDAPIAPSSRGVGIWKNDLSVDEIAKRRHELLSVTGSDLLRVNEKYLMNPTIRSDTIIGPQEALLRQEADNPMQSQTEAWKQLKL